jgi:hypothetical protein
VSGVASVLVRSVEVPMMPSDLPSRPPRGDDEPVEKIADTDRVKAKGDKVEPRFEALRKRVDREGARRAKADATRKARDAGADADQDEDSTTPEATADAGGETTEPEPPKTGFSWNQTTRRPSGGERNGSDG